MGKWHMPVIPAYGRQEDQEVRVLGYITSSRPHWLHETLSKKFLR